MASNRAPIPRLPAALTGAPETPIAVDAGESSDPDGVITRYKLTVMDRAGTVVWAVERPVPQLFALAPVPGVYLVKLTVMDNRSSGRSTTTSLTAAWPVPVEPPAEPPVEPPVEPAPLPNIVPTGYVDDVIETASGGREVFGWAYDPNATEAPITVRVMIDGALAVEALTEDARHDVNTHFGILGVHGFRIPLPAVYRDGQPHTLAVEAVDLEQPSMSTVLNPSKLFAWAPAPVEPVEPPVEEPPIDPPVEPEEPPVIVIPVEPPPSGSALVPSQLRYVGPFLLPMEPDDQKPLGHSFGTFTLRRVDGQLRIITTGKETWTGNLTPDPLYEAVVPEVFDGRRAQFKTWWGDIYKGQRVWSGAVANNPSFLGGLAWDEQRQGVWVAWKDSYGINVNDPSLLFVKLNDDGTSETLGPWRTTAGSHMTGGYMTLLPPQFANREDLKDTWIYGKRLLLSAMYGSGGSASPWGINAHVVKEEPTAATPRDVLTDRIAHVPVQALVNFRYWTYQPAPIGLRRAVCAPSQEGLNPSAPLETVLPVLGPVVASGKNVFNDYITSTCWVNLRDGRQCVLFATSFVDGGTEEAHTWYGNNVCVHNRSDPEGTQGPHSTHRKLGLLCYDQEDFAKIVKGELAPEDIRHTAYLPLWKLIPGFTESARYDSKLTTGSIRLAFDAESQRLFLVDARKDETNPYAYRGVVHVLEFA